MKQEPEESVSMKQLKMQMINIFYILTKYKQDRFEIVMFFLEYIKAAISRYYRCILLAVKVISEIRPKPLSIHNNRHERDEKSGFDTKLIELIQKDIEKCQSVNLQQAAQ